MNVHDFNWLDWFLLVIVMVSAAFGIQRGFAREVLSLAVWLLASVVAWALGDHLATLLTGWFKDAEVRLSCAMLILFMMTLLIGALLNHLLAQMVKNSGLTAADRVLGAVFGIVRGVIVVIVLLVFLPSSMAYTPAWEHSHLVPRFIAIEHSCQGLAQDIAGIFHSSAEKH